jgi:5-methylcytosine-specific restriction protein A
MQSGNVCALPSCNHQLFKTRNEKVYLEAHHLIPLSVCDQFPVNIDIPENIVCLCPSCHREIHHGSNARKMIEELYEQRKGLRIRKPFLLYHVRFIIPAS